MFPSAARANRSIFYADESARSIGQVYDLLVARQRNTGAATAPADNGAFFSGKIDFGNWKPTIEMDLPIKVKAKPQLASADGISLFDYLAGKGKTASTAPSDPDTTASIDAPTWSAEVAPHQDELPFITVADDYSIGQGDAAATADAPPAAAQPSVRALMAEAEAPRIKIIHVPQKK